MGRASDRAPHSAFGEAETLLDERCQLADAAAVGAKNFHGAGGSDDDLGPDGSLAHLHSRKAVLREFLGEELAQLSVEDAIGDELALLADVVLGDNGCRHCFACKGWRVRSLQLDCNAVLLYEPPNVRRWNERVQRWQHRELVLEADEDARVHSAAAWNAWAVGGGLGRGEAWRAGAGGGGGEEGKGRK